MLDSIAVLDSCVLYPAPLRDFLMHLAASDLFRARWTEAIHDEWIRNVLLNRPDLTLEQLTRTKDLMNRAVRDCLVEGYESLVETVNLPDADDRHVLAAAVHAKANFIVTFNLRDFPPQTLADYGMAAVAPDEFISSLIEQNAPGVVLAAERQRSSLKNPPKSRAQYLETLRQQNLPETCRRLDELLPPE